MDGDSLNTDASNCGVYMCYYAKELSDGKNIDEIAKNRLSKKEITLFRSEILQTIAKESTNVIE